MMKLDIIGVDLIRSIPNSNLLINTQARENFSFLIIKPLLFEPSATICR